MKQRYLVVTALTMIATLVASTDPVVAQVGGNPPTGGAGATHVPEYMRAWFGENWIDNRPEFEVEDNWEHVWDHTPVGNPGEPCDRSFGAYATANKNDSDSDGLIDGSAGDSSVMGEVDLIYIEIKRPTKQPDGFDSAKDIATLTFHSFPGGSPNGNEIIPGGPGVIIQTWADRWLTTPFVFSADMLDTNPTVGFYVEFKEPSPHLGSIAVHFNYVPDGKVMPPPPETELEVPPQFYDRIQLTGIWSTGTGHVEVPPVEVTTVNHNANTITISTAGNGVMLAKCDWVAIFDDNGQLDYAKTWTLRRVIDDPESLGPPGIPSTSYRVTLGPPNVDISAWANNAPNEYPNVNDITSPNLPEWVDPTDSFRLDIDGRINGEEIIRSHVLGSCQMGSSRLTPTTRYGIVHKFRYKPDEILTKKLSHGHFLNVDITRQIFQRSRGFHNDGTIDYDKDDYPFHPEMPNDDSGNVDEDLRAWPFASDVYPNCPPLDDVVFSLDAPGFPTLLDIANLQEYKRLEMRANFREWSRLAFSPNKIWTEFVGGTRSSDKVKWRFAQNIEPDDVKNQNEPRIRFWKRWGIQILLDNHTDNEVVPGTHLTLAEILELDDPSQ